METLNKISLFCKEGTSDKEYHVEITTIDDENYQVNFSYGRRGSTLKPGTKTPAPVNYEQAVKIYDALVREKLKGGYDPGEEGTRYVGTTDAERNTNVHVQLLIEIEEENLEKFFADDDYIAQEKFDGMRMALCADGDEVYGSNRSALKCGIPETFISAMKAIQATLKTDDTILDGESIGDNLYCFDMLRLTRGADLHNEPYLFRYDSLKRTIELTKKATGMKNIHVVKIAEGEAAKRTLFEEIKNRRGEGIVFKRKDAPYKPGKVNKGGTQFKFKFCADATCIVSRISTGKRSVHLQVLNDDGTLRDIGKCTIPVNKDVPAEHSLVDIKYLYAYPNGSLFQPVFKDVRFDKTEPDLYSSLKFKAENTDPDEENI